MIDELAKDRRELELRGVGQEIEQRVGVISGVIGQDLGGQRPFCLAAAGAPIDISQGSISLSLTGRRAAIQWFTTSTFCPTNWSATRGAIVVQRESSGANIAKAQAA